MSYNDEKNNSFTRTGTYKKERPKPCTLNLRITLRPSVNGGQDYTDESAETALTHLNDEILPYINIPVIMNRATLMNDREKKGTVNVGYIKQYNNENDNHTFEIIIFNKFAEDIKNMDSVNDLRVAVNCVAKNDSLEKFVSFELII